MEQVTPAGGGPASPVKLCECGCGQPAPIAKMTSRARGYVKGQPMRFVAGHKPGVRGPHPKQRRLFAEEGQRIGRCVVLDPDVPYWETNQKRNVRAVRLRCECGREFVRRIGVVFKHPDIQACMACASYADLAGRRYGKLIAVRRVASSAPGPGGKWLCTCDCGNEVTVVRASLTTGNTKSCGCGRFGPLRGLAVGQAAFKAVLRGYQNGAETRGLSWGLAEEDFRRLTSLPCHYCGTAPATVSKGHPSSGSYTYNGLDRVDNTLGYSLKNVVPACKSCNYAKRDMPYGEFMAWIARIASFHFFRPEVMPARLIAPRRAG